MSATTLPLSFHNKLAAYWQETDSQKRWLRLGAFIWFVPLLVICISVIHQPLARTVTSDYHWGVESWWARTFFVPYYTPQFYLLFTPFHFLPRVIGDLLWRLAGAGAVIFGLHHLLQAMFRRESAKAFALISLVTLPLILGSIRNGQGNTVLAASLLLAASFLIREKWGLAALCLMGAIAKPIGLPAIGLAFVIFPKFRRPLAITSVIFLMVPFLFGPPIYVFKELSACVTNLQQVERLAQTRFANESSDPVQISADERMRHTVRSRRFADINGVLRAFGIPLNGWGDFIMRISAAMAFAGWCWRLARKRRGNPVPLWYSASAIYLMLFNPMNEPNSYIILAPALGWTFWEFFQRGWNKRAWLLVGIICSMNLLPNLARPFTSHQFANDFVSIWCPAMTILFAGLLVWQRATEFPELAGGAALVVPQRSTSPIAVSLEDIRSS